MATITDNAVCIRRWDFSETSQTVSLLTREHGVLRGLAKGAKRPKGAFSGGIELLTRGHVGAIVKPTRELATLTEWRLEELFPAVRTNLRANRAAFYLIDLVHHMITAHDPHPDVFDALVDALRGMAQPGEMNTAMLRFQWLLLKSTGYSPQLAHDAETGRPLTDDQRVLAFHPDAGGMVADTGDGDRWRVRRQTVIVLQRLAAGEALDADTKDIQRANRLLATYFRHLMGMDLPTMTTAFGEEVSKRSSD